MTTLDLTSRTIIQSSTQTTLVSNNGIGPPGPQGPKGEKGDSQSYSYVVASPLGGHRVVYLDSNSQLAYADNTNLISRFTIVGLTLNSASALDTVVVQRQGELEESSWDWTLNLPIFLNTNGTLTQTPPSGSNKYSLIIGFPITNTKIYISLQEPLVLG